MLGENSPNGLGVIHDLLASFHEQNIVYCHWKSNEHLGAAMNGDTDLDLLFQERDQSLVESILIRNGFKHFEAVPSARYPGILDFISVDPHTKKIVHVHAHFKLTLGEKYLKGYHVPWEEFLLRSRIFDSEHGIYVAERNAEVVLLLIRQALKHQTRDFFRRAWLRNWLDGDSERELRWLLDHVDEASVAETARKMVGRDVANLFPEMLRTEIRGIQSLPFIRAVRRSLRIYRNYSTLGSKFRRWSRELRFVVLRGAQKFLGTSLFGLPARRVLPHEGKLITFVGTDGAGKSTALASTSKWLGTKIDVLPMYLGSGQGQSSFIRKPFQVLRNLVLKRSKGKAPWRDVENGTVHRPAFAFLRSIWAVLLVVERKAKLRKCWRARQYGVIVLTDRFPQCQVLGFNDGPLLSSFLDSRSLLARWIAHWEQKQYIWMSRTYYPDLLIRLEVSPTVAAERRPEMSVEESLHKQQALFRIQWSERTKVITVDANRSLPEVIDNIRTVVWNEL